MGANVKNCLQAAICGNGEEKEIGRNGKEEIISRNEVKTTVGNGEDVVIGGNIEQYENEKKGETATEDLEEGAIGGHNGNGDGTIKIAIVL